MYVLRLPSAISLLSDTMDGPTTCRRAVAGLPLTADQSACCALCVAGIQTDEGWPWSSGSFRPSTASTEFPSALSVDETCCAVWAGFMMRLAWMPAAASVLSCCTYQVGLA